METELGPTGALGEVAICQQSPCRRHSRTGCRAACTTMSKRARTGTDPVRRRESHAADGRHSSPRAGYNSGAGRRCPRRPGTGRGDRGRQSQVADGGRETSAVAGQSRTPRGRAARPALIANRAPQEYARPAGARLALTGGGALMRRAHQPPWQSTTPCPRRFNDSTLRSSDAPAGGWTARRESPASGLLFERACPP